MCKICIKHALNISPLGITERNYRVITSGYSNHVGLVVKIQAYYLDSDYDYCLVDQRTMKTIQRVHSSSISCKGNYVFIKRRTDNIFHPEYSLREVP